MPHYFADFLHSSCQKYHSRPLLELYVQLLLLPRVLFLSWLYLPPLWPLFPLLNVLAQLSLPLLFHVWLFLPQAWLLFHVQYVAVLPLLLRLLSPRVLAQLFLRLLLSLCVQPLLLQHALFLRELSAQQLSALVLSAHATFPLHEPLWLL